MPRAMWKMPLLAAQEAWARPGRVRQLEPMVMDEPESVAQFHDGGATSSGMRAVHDLSARCLDALLPEGARLLDLGCGSGRALAYLAERRPDITAKGVDLAPNMLARAADLFAAEDLSGRIELAEADITALPEAIAGDRWDAVSCVWTLHHLPDNEALDAVLRQIARLRANLGCAVWILDFQRLKCDRCFQAGLQISEPDLDARLRLDATASEAAAFTYAELASALARAGWHDVRGGCAWPVPWQQAHWTPSTHHPPHASPCWRPGSLQGSARLDALLLRCGFRGLPI